MSARFLTLGLVSAVLALPAAAASPAAAGPGILTQILFFLPLILIFYFLLIRPQQQRQKKHVQMVNNVKRGDTIVTAGGVIGKVNKVSDTEISVDIAENVRVRVVKSMIIEVRNKAEPVPAND